MTATPWLYLKARPTLSRIDIGFSFARSGRRQTGSLTRGVLACKMGPSYLRSVPHTIPAMCAIDIAPLGVISPCRGHAKTRPLKGEDRARSDRPSSYPPLEEDRCKTFQTTPAQAEVQLGQRCSAMEGVQLLDPGLRRGGT